MPLVKLYADGNSMTVHHLYGLLLEAGVDATVMGDALGAARGELPLTVETMPAIWIHDRDVDRARPIVERFMAVNSGLNRPPKPEVASWQCAKCGEQIEGQFTQCWACGAQQPGSGPPPLPAAE